MLLSVDPRSATPPFEQLRRQVTALACTDRLPAGTRLPTVRALAGDLGLAPNTVAHAYRVLEREGVVETRGRHGTFVAARGRGQAEAAEAAAAFAERVRGLGVDPAEAVRLVRVALDT